MPDSSRPARSSAATIAVMALVALAGVAVYGVINVTRSTPAEANGQTGPNGTPGQGPAASDVLAQVDPLITDGQWPKAIALLVPAIEAHPDEQELHLALARCLSGQKDWARSSTAYDAAISIGPESPQLLAEAATVANAAGLLDIAIERFARAQQLDDRNPLHPLYLGMVQIKAGREKEAMASLYTATVLKPDLAAAWGVMGELELRANHLDMALQHLEKARKIEPESWKWRLAEAKVRKRQNEPGRALDLLINLPEKDRYHADSIGVIAESLTLLKQQQRRSEYLAAAKAWAKLQSDAKAIEQIERFASASVN